MGLDCTVWVTTVAGPHRFVGAGGEGVGVIGPENSQEVGQEVGERRQGAMRVSCQTGPVGAVVTCHEDEWVVGAEYSH